MSRGGADVVRAQHPAGPLRGTLQVPGDKSVSHRSLIFGGQGRGVTRVRGLLRSGDVQATWGAMQALGVHVEDRGDEVLVHGVPELSEPDDVVDCGNSGTSIRLLVGVMARVPGHAVLTGDASLRRRPMARVAEPLRRMGARIDGREGGRLAPLSIRGGALSPMDHDLPIASAQVKSCLLLAGLGCGARVREPRRSRDHSERFLAAMGRPLTVHDDGWLEVTPGPLDAVDVTVPGDVSSAAFLLVAASVVPGSEVVLPGVGVNPTRTGVVDALRAMGASIEVVDADHQGVEPFGTLVVRHAPLTGARIDGELALRSLDELPVLAIAAAFAEGETVIADARELRVKESDRIARVAEGLRQLSVEVEERPDGMLIQGGVHGTAPARVDASGDHRIAMAFTVAGLAAPCGVEVHAADAVASSWPTFYEDLTSLLSGSPS